MIIAIGSRIKDGKGNDYEIIEDIGQGGFGCVYKSVRECDKKIFAVKTLPHSFIDSESVASFNNEIALADTIHGANIIHYEFIHNGKTYPDYPPYIIMEYANNGTLRDLINDRKKQDKPFVLNELLPIYSQLIAGMRAINEKLIHRDIKPENILLCDDTLKLTDFGISKIVTETTRTKSFKGYGTYPYMAPEAWTEQDNTIQMDIYAMGIVFYELATLQYPYTLKRNDFEEYRNAHWYAPVNNVSLLQTRTNPIIASMILRMLQKPAQNRFSNWNEIEAQLSKECENKSLLDNLVLETVATKTKKDTERQLKIEQENKERQEKENFCKLVTSQIESTVFKLIEDYVNKVNNATSSTDKCVLRHLTKSSTQFKSELSVPDISHITIKGKIILPNSESRLISTINDWGNEIQYTQPYTPKYNDKDITCWILIENKEEVGFNLMLVKSQGLYGDWYIVENKNNFSLMGAGRVMPEPFAFELDALQDALISMTAISSYSSRAQPFDENLFMTFFAKLLK